MNGTNIIPRTHNGEGLAYISPEEAIWLRQMGGGIDGNTGPGGIPSFAFGTGSGVGTGFGAFGGMGVAGSTGVGAGVGPPGQGLGVGPQYGGGPTSPYSPSESTLTFAPPPPQSRGGAPGWVTSGQVQQPVAAVAPAVEELVDEEGRRLPTEEEIAERAAKLNARLRAGAERLQSMYAALGYGPVGPRYGETSSGEEFFPGSTPVPISEIPAWRGLAAGPAGPSIEAGLNTSVTGQPPTDLLGRVAAIADEIALGQGTRAAHGGLVGRYDLGGLVDSMMLQASRSRENIPSNMVL